MTYEDAYMQCESIEELEKMVNKDIKTARWFNADRIPIIAKSATKVANLKFGEVYVGKGLTNKEKLIVILKNNYESNKETYIKTKDVLYLGRMQALDFVLKGLETMNSDMEDYVE